MRPPELGRIVCGDAFKLIPALPDRSVNLVLTSPPYAEQRKHHFASVPENEYPLWACKLMAAFRPKLTDDGSVLLVMRTHLRNGIISDYLLRTRLALREDGWCECEELIWLKPDAPPLGSNERPRRTWENILWFSKTPRPFVNLTANGNFSDRVGFAGSKQLRNGNHPIAAKHPSKMKMTQARTTDQFVALVSENVVGIRHPAMFPVTLCEKLILPFSPEGSVVLDPFCGAGSTLLAAQRLGRRWIGFDIKREYVEIAANRLNTTFTEPITTINSGVPVRLRTDFPDTAKSRRIYFRSCGLNESDAAVFEFILSKTVYCEDRKSAAEISHNQIAAATQQSRRTVIRSMNRLADAKFVETEKNGLWHLGRPNRVAIPPSLLMPIEVEA